MSKWEVVPAEPGTSICCIVDAKSREHLVCSLDRGVAQQIVREHNAHGELVEIALDYIFTVDGEGLDVYDSVKTNIDKVSVVLAEAEGRME